MSKTRPNQDAASDVRMPDAPGRRRLPILLRRAWYGLNQTFRRRIAHLDITPDQFTALRTISEAAAPGLVQSELTALMASDPNTIASLLSRMESGGLIEREIHERDRRAYRIRLLPEGQRRFDEAKAIAVGLQADVLSVVPEGEREKFLERLGQMADRCHELARSAR